MNGSEIGGEQLQLTPDPKAIAWSRLQELSSRERELAHELDNVREQLQEHAREMKRARIASVPQIAKSLERNRQRVNDWMRIKKPLREDAGDDHAEDWIDPEAHVPF
jgi:septation ring formation regulator EzrA